MKYSSLLFPIGLVSAVTAEPLRPVTTAAPEPRYVKETGRHKQGENCWEQDGYYTSVHYSTGTTSTWIPYPSAWPHPYYSGSQIKADKAGWTDISIPWTTVYEWQNAEKAYATKAIYQDTNIITVVVVKIAERTKSGSVVYVPGPTQRTLPWQQAPAAVTYTPTADYKPYHKATPTSSAGYAAQTHNVELRAEADGTVHYVPDRVHAEIGDVVNFVFKAREHSVTQSSFDKPCSPLEGGFDSGLIANPLNLHWQKFERQFTVDTKDPLWFYCKLPAANHCGQGMVFGINPAGKMRKFIKNAIKQNGDLVTLSPLTATPSATYKHKKPSKTYGHAPATSTVVVGGVKGGDVPRLTYQPNNLKHLRKGDHIIFDFLTLNHTLTESTYENPCTKKVGGAVIDTGFANFNPENIPGLKRFEIVLDTDEYTPRYFYCAQGNGLEAGHCRNGMVFAINVDRMDLAQFRRNARATEPTIVA